MNSQVFIILIILIILIISLIYLVNLNYSNSNSNSNCINYFRRIHPNKLYDNLNRKQLRAKNKQNQQNNKQNQQNQQKNKQKFSVNCYNDTACQNQKNGTGCRTIFYTDGVCLKDSCIPTDDYDEYRMAIISENTQGFQNIEKYAKLYQDYQKTFVPPACSEYVSFN